MTDSHRLLGALRTRSAAPSPGQTESPDHVGTEELHTLRDFAAHKLAALAEALSLPPPQVDAAHETLSVLSRGWADVDLALPARWPSDITDDHSPFELSLAFAGDRLELRLLAESQPALPRLHSAAEFWQAGVATTRELAERHGVSLEDFDAISDLFAPTEHASARFALWHGAVVTGDGRPWFKVYFNPGMYGADQACARIRTALERLGLPDAWAPIERVCALAPDSIALPYFSLDLREPGSQPRVKVYASHPEVDTATLERRLLASGCFSAPAMVSTVETLTGQAGPFSQRPLLTCFGFVRGRGAPEITLHVPVRNYVEDDELAVGRLAALLERSRAVPIQAAARAYAERPLRAGRGLLTYVSVRFAGSEARFVAYLSPEVYAVQPPLGRGLTSDVAPRFPSPTDGSPTVDGAAGLGRNE